jgi:hypothetical protein
MKPIQSMNAVKRQLGPACADIAGVHETDGRQVFVIRFVDEIMSGFYSSPALASGEIAFA